MTKTPSQPIDILITRRLTLRPPLDVDAEAIVRGLSDIDVASRLTSVPQPYSEKDARDWIARNRSNPEKCKYTVHREQLIGVVSVHEKYDTPTLGYWFAKPFWGKGYATEAARAVLARAFRVYRTDVIESYAFEDNVASLRVMEKLGFEAIGKGETFCKALGTTKPDVKTKLKRAAFERLFGALDAKEAA
ncbi:MAG: GNAT family N-acetyltransferase [Pseudomonadota bacterium]